MLALVTIFLTTLIVAAAAVWLYRSISSWQGFKRTMVRRRMPAVRMKINAQQGYIWLVQPSRKASMRTRSRDFDGDIKAPWGW